MNKIITLVLGVIAVTGCNTLDVSESNFNHKNLTSIIGLSRLTNLEAVPPETVKKLFTDHGLQGEELNGVLAGETHFYAWQGGNPFSEFVIYTNDGCFSDLVYFIYDGSNYLDSKVVSRLADCGDFMSVQDVSINGSSFKITYKDQDMGDLYENHRLENCVINSEGKFECDQLISIDPGLSLWNGLALRETPEKDGKYITVVNMGETFRTADSVEVNDDDEYIFVELKGGMSGYILNRLVMPEAVPLAIRYDADIYSRPDELTKTNKTFSRMDLVGVSETSGMYEWYKVKGRTPGDKWFKEGWIKAERGSRHPLDLAVASLVNQALEEKDSTKRFQMLRDIFKNPDLQEGFLRNYVSDFLPGV